MQIPFLEEPSQRRDERERSLLVHGNPRGKRPARAGVPPSGEDADLLMLSLVQGASVSRFSLGYGDHYCKFLQGIVSFLVLSREGGAREPPEIQSRATPVPAPRRATVPLRHFHTSG